MYNLRMLSTKPGEEVNTEFFKDDLPLRFLPEVKQLNIIVGANNSRKSRFLRSVISLEIPVVIESACDLNDFYVQGEDVFWKFDALKNSGLGGVILGAKAFSSSNDVSELLYDYFREVQNVDRVVRNANVMLLVKQVLELISSIFEEKSMPDLNRKVEYLKVIGKFIQYFYQDLAKHNGEQTDYDNLPDSDFKYLNPEVPGSLGIKLKGAVPMVSEVLEATDLMMSWIESLGELKVLHHRKKNIYIPVLRSSRTLVGGDGDVYESTIKRQYFKNAKPNKLEIETGLQLYDKIRYASNGTTTERKAFKEFERFIGQTFFKSPNIEIIAHVPKGLEERNIIVSIPGQRQDVPIYDLGDGVQGIINLLFPIFTAEKNDWIFIDEPENHLHPGYQNIFIRALAENEFLVKKDLRYFINTHSNHILSESFLSAADTSVFVFSARDEHSSDIRAFEQNRYSTLELLGVMNTSVFVTNCTIWVEGITDRFYIRAFLHAYLNSLPGSNYHPNEGFDFSFIEYAGKNLVHYDFDERNDDNISSYFLNSNVFILADSDFDEEKHKKYSRIKRNNFVYVQTNLPEIENLLPVETLKKFLLEELKCDRSSLPELSKGFSDDKLGALFSKVKKDGKLVKICAKYGGTLSPYYKSLLSKYVYEKIMKHEIDWATLSTSADLKRVVEKLYGFISEKNKKEVKFV
jgi:hypothetical protein